MFKIEFIMTKHIPLFLLIFLPFILLRCSGNNKDASDSSGGSAKEQMALEMIKSTDEDGNLVTFSKRTNGDAKEGVYRKMTPDSVLMEVAFYENDTLEGARILFSEKGDTQVVETYRRGIFDGPYNAYHANGQLEFSGKYENNAMEGTWKRFYDSGMLMETVTFAGNDENGPFVEYNENGTLKAEGNYKGGDNEDGELKVYDENGVLLKTMLCDNGMCKTIWKKK